MDSCCNKKQDELTKVKFNHKNILLIVFLINLGMFFIEFTFGVRGKSNALLGDSLDMLGDAFVYGLSFYVVSRGALLKARVALVKGLIMSAMAFGIIIDGYIKYSQGIIPQAPTMMSISVAAAIANVACVILLFRFRGDDINMRSTWQCSRNDVISNISVLFAGFLVHKTESSLPDVLIGVGISLLFLKSGSSIIREAYKELIQGQLHSKV